MEDWGAGWWVDPDETAVAAALSAFLASPRWPAAQRARLSTRAQDWFSWDRVGPQYMELYRSFAARNARG